MYIYFKFLSFASEELKFVKKKKISNQIFTRTKIKFWHNFQISIPYNINCAYLEEGAECDVREVVMCAVPAALLEGPMPEVYEFLL